MTFDYRQFSQKFSRMCHAVYEAERDIQIAITEPKAMNAGNRIKSEFKAVAGLAGLVVSCAEANPVGIFCSAGSVGEGLYDLDRAGHRYRIQHPVLKRKIA